MVDKAFYPTYEEWKPAIDAIVYGSLHAFYPTYEEWKRKTIEEYFGKDKSFYPTYEEWKQSSLGMIRHAEYFLFILPMRNGNFFLKFHLTIH